MADDPLKMSDVTVYPTLVITQDQYGDIKFGTNTDQITTEVAISMCMLAINKLSAQHFITVRTNMVEAEKNASKIYVPELKIKGA